MSISIFPVGNLEFCKANNLVEIIKEDCLCDETNKSSCHYCKGAGIYSFEKYPCEMNISNGNFKTLWNALGLEHDYCGEICPKKIMEVLKTFDPDLLLAANYVDASGESAIFYSFGIDKDRAMSYISRLKDIAMHAISRGVNICWG